MRPLMLSTLALALLLPLAACSQSDPGDARDSADTSIKQAMKEASDKLSSPTLTGEIRQALDEAKQELAHKNIDVGRIRIGKARPYKDDTLPKAQITPDGDLLIEGTAVPATAAQRALILDYRAQVIEVASVGIDLGAEGADLGIHAAKEAIWGAMGGKSQDDIEASIKPQVEKIRIAALQLCKRLPAMMSSQQALAAAMPEFKPYATLTQKDIDDCGQQTGLKNGESSFSVSLD